MEVSIFKKNKIYSRYNAYNDFLCHHTTEDMRLKNNLYFKFIYKLFLGIFVRVVGILHYLFNRTNSCNEYRILILPACSQNENRLQPILNILKKSGAKVYIEYQNTYGHKKRKMSFGYVPLDVPSDLLLQYSEGTFLLQKYNPKVVLFMQNSGLLPAIIRNSTQKVVTVNLSHGITYSDDSFSMFDYDYYFMFGRSSINFARQNRKRFGTTKAILAGSPFIDTQLLRMDNGETGNSIVYFSQWLAPEFVDEIQFSNNIVCEFADRNRHRKIVIKLHPLEDEGFWKKKSILVNNLEIINGTEEIVSILEKSTLSLIAWSNAAIESTIAARPFIAIDNNGRAEEYLKVGKYFPVVNSVENLELAIENIESSYAYYITACRDFVKQHVQKLDDSQGYISKTIIEILQGNSVDGEIIDENYNW